MSTVLRNAANNLRIVDNSMTSIFLSSIHKHVLLNASVKNDMRNILSILEKMKEWNATIHAQLGENETKEETDTVREEPKILRAKYEVPSSLKNAVLKDGCKIQPFSPHEQCSLDLVLQPLSAKHKTAFELEPQVKEERKVFHDERQVSLEPCPSRSNDDGNYGGKMEPFPAEECRAAAESPFTLVAKEISVQTKRKIVRNSAARSSTSGSYHENTDFERTIFVQNFPGYWTYEDRLAIMCRFGTPEKFTRVKNRKHGKCGYVAVFATNKVALQAQGLLDNIRVGKHVLSVGPPPLWAQMKHGISESHAFKKEAEHNRRELRKILMPFVISYAAFGIFTRGTMQNKNVTIRMFLGYLYPGICQCVVFFSLYACYSDALRGATENEQNAADMIRNFSVGNYLLAMELVKWTSFYEMALCPVSDNVLVKGN